MIQFAGFRDVKPFFSPVSNGLPDSTVVILALRTVKLSLWKWPHRTIHAPFQPKTPRNPRGYCGEHFLNHFSFIRRHLQPLE
jgi:hypothetical protein